MVSNLPRAMQKAFYEREAQTYLRSLPLEHFMEATAQAQQRKITLESFDLVQARCPDVHVFNELLVQYPRRGKSRLGQVVPDNMVVLCTEPIEAQSSYNVPLQPAGPFWVFEYVSPSNPRKDYEDGFRKYERDLKVPYYLVFRPAEQELALYRHDGRRYAAVAENKHGRRPIPELDMEVALDGWARFWHKGKLLPLPADLQTQLEKAHSTISKLQESLQAAERELAVLRRGSRK